MIQGIVKGGCTIMAANELTHGFQKNSKFAILAVNNVYTDLPSATFRLSDETRIMTDFPIPDFGIWREWLGSIHTARLGNTNLVLVVEELSENPGVLDDVHIHLSNDLCRLFSMLHLRTGIEMANSADLLCGSSVSGVSEIRRLSQMPTFFQSEGWMRAPITRDWLEEGVILRGGATAIEADAGLFRRVRRGLHTLLKGLREKLGEDRLHQFVRSLEALIHPEKGDTKRQFVHRCQTFATPGEDTRTLLKEAYDMRSATEHLNPQDQCEEVSWKRTRQIEHLACNVYSRLLCDSVVRKHFKTGNEIDAFWGLQDGERYGLWGTPLDISQVL